MSFEKSRGVTSASWPNSPIGLLIIPISADWLHHSVSSPPISWCGGRSGALWLPSHHPGGCCTLEVDEEIPPDNVECLEKAEKHYINVMDYYYYVNDYTCICFI